MAGDHQQPSRRKHQHNSDDESEEPSKRHKHRHHHHNRRHRHHHSQKLQLEDEVKQETDTEEISQHLPPPLLAVVSNGNSRTDYDMEEGEILDDDEGFDIENKKLDSHEIMNGVGVAFDSASLSLGGENDKVGSGSMILLEDNCDDNIKGNSKVDGKENINVDTKENVSGDISKKDNNQSSLSPSPEGLAKGKGYSNGESEFRGQSKSLLSETAGKKHKSFGSLRSHERLREEDRSKSTSQSHDRARERSRSRSIVQDARDTAYHTDRKHSRDLEFESISRRHRDYPIGSWDSSREKERERSSSYGRHSVRVDRHQSLEYQDRERKRERERRRERERDRNSCCCSYDNVNVGYGDHDRYNDYGHQRLDETEHRDRSRKSDAVKAHRSKSDHSASDTEKLQRDEVEQEDYQERIVLQLAEQEEEDLNRIKEESRKRRQAILEKYKTLQPKPKDETNLEETVKESAEQPSDAAETCSNQNEAADVSLTDTPLSIGKSFERDEPLVSKISGTGELGRGTPKSERLDDMFCDDIFGDSPTRVRKQGRVDGLTIEKNGLHDNWDDAEGYYSYRFGEVLDGRYEVVAAHGKGVYSNVVRAKDLKAGPGNPEEVAIKIIRSNDIMYKAGLEELIILKKLVGADPEDRRHCVRLLSSFKYRNHLCLVFESLHMNLREVLKKFGRNIGLKLTAVRTYAQQLFIALKHLRNCSVLHSDIKPDNMLVNEAKNVLKLSDFGNAMFAGKNEITPYLVSRFYRAPEIILGLAYDHPMDIWSVGCSLFELYSGRVLFPGPSNNDMLRLHMELKGPFPKKILRKGAFTDQHFDQDLNFLATEEDPVTKKAIKRLIPNIKPKDIGTIVSGSTGENPKMLAYFKDLLEKIFMLDPDKRITVSQALSHPFITGK